MSEEEKGKRPFHRLNGLDPRMGGHVDADRANEGRRRSAGCGVLRACVRACS